MSYLIKNKADLEQFICHQWNEINAHINLLQKKYPQPLYSSIDIRESSRKLAPIDNNLYPAGFNNLCQKDLQQAKFLMQDFLQSHFPTHDLNQIHLGLIPESHTKNLWYLENVFHLAELIRSSGVQVTLVTPDKALFSDKEGKELSSLALTTQSGKSLEIFPLEIRDHLSFEKQHALHGLILNNDQSSPLPVDWKKLKTPVFPSPFAGWNNRQKNSHFSFYKKCADEFCAHFKIDPDLIQAKFIPVENVDFDTKQGLDFLASNVDTLLKELPPSSKVFVKASQGTYGMGIQVFKSGDEVLNMNRRTRNKLDVGKNNIKFTSVIVQEGVETILKVEEAPAEVTVYLINGQPAGGFIRYNPERDDNANLNSQGMVYRKLCLSDVKPNTDTLIKEAAYSIVARLSVLAASMELATIHQQV